MRQALLQPGPRLPETFEQEADFFGDWAHGIDRGEPFGLDPVDVMNMFEPEEALHGVQFTTHMRGGAR